MKISAEADYAVRIIVYLYGCKKREKKIEILEKCKIPKSWGSAIITKLVKNKILLSSQGKLGGIEFNFEKRNLSIYDVIKEFDDIKLNRCLSSLKNCTKDPSQCNLCKEFIKINNQIIIMMSEIKIKNLLES